MDNDDEDFLKLLHSIEQSGEDCPENLVKLAKSPFERAVCVEIFKFYKEFQSFKAEQKTNTKWITRIVIGVFGTVILSLILELLRLLFHI